jgi:hypothetical protein
MIMNIMKLPVNKNKEKIILDQLLIFINFAVVCLK